MIITDCKLPVMYKTEMKFIVNSKTNISVYLKQYNKNIQSSNLKLLYIFYFCP